MAIRKIGQIMVDLGFLDEDQLEMLLDEQQQRPDELLGQIAISLSLINEGQLAQALAEQMNLPIVHLADVVVSSEVLAYVNEPMAQLYRVIPVSFKDGVLTVATSQPQKLSVLDELRSFLGYEIRAVVTTDQRRRKGAGAVLRRRSGESVESLISDMEDDEDLAAVGRSAWRRAARWT